MYVSAFIWILIFFIIYGAVHSWMASLRFKAFLENRWPGAYRRCYRLFFNIFSLVTFLPVMAAVVLLPDIEIYRLSLPWSLVFRALQLSALVLFTISLFQTDVWSFGGLRQAVNTSPQTAPPSNLVTGGFYGLVRHPLYFFGILFMWLSPSLSWNGLGFNLGATVYILIGMVFEERKLLREFGAEYARYRETVPGLIPFTKFRR